MLKIKVLIDLAPLVEEMAISGNGAWLGYLPYQPPSNFLGLVNHLFSKPTHFYLESHIRQPYLIRSQSRQYLIQNTRPETLARHRPQVRIPAFRGKCFGDTKIQPEK